MRRFLIIIAWLSLATLAVARYWHHAEFTMPRLDGDYLQRIRTDRLITPHLPFAKPLAGGPVRALFIVHLANARDVVELGQRLDLRFDAVTVVDGERIADDFPFTTAVLGQSSPEKARELEARLDQRYDVICLANLSFDKLPPASQLKVLRAVRNGTGLVGVFANTRSKQAIERPLNPPVPGRDVLRGCALAGLPYFQVAEQSKRDAAADQTLSTAHFGKGRIAWLNYSAPCNLGGWYMGDCLGRPAVASPEGYDVAMGIAARALLWAAGREPALRIQSELADGASIPQAEWPKAFSAKLQRVGGPSPGEVKVEARLFRSDGEFAAAATVKATTTGTDLSAAIPLPPAPQGIAFLGLIARNAKGEVLDWSMTSLTVTGAGRIAGVTPDREVVNPGETVKVSVNLPGDLPAGARVQADAVDVYGRVFWRQEMAAAASLELAVPTASACGRQARVRVRLVADQQVRDTAQTEFFLKRPVGLEFINLMWGHPGLGPRDGQARGYLNDLMARQLRAAGFNTGMLFPCNGSDDTIKASRALSRVDARWMIYSAFVNDALCRSYFDPQVRAKEEQRLEALAAQARAYGPYVYSLGDENSYVVHEDLKPAELAAYREYLKRAYGNDLAMLNRAWNASYAGFDRIEAAPAGDAAWTVSRRYDLRAFWEWVYADTHHWKREAIRRGDPEAQVGAEGSASGDLERTISKLDWWAPYEDRLTNGQLRFWMPPQALRGNWWGGYTVNQGGRDGPSILWRQLVTGAVNASCFFVACVAAEAMFATDLDDADYFTPWRPELRDICETAGPLLRASPPADDGVGIYWSRLSDHANELDPRFGNGQIAQSDLSRLCDALGVNAKFVTERQILAGKLTAATTRILFMCSPKAVPDQLAPALEKFVQEGGVLVADVGVDLRDGHAAEVPPGRLLPLFGAKAAGPSQPITAAIRFADIRLGAATLALSAGECLVDSGVAVGEGQTLAAVGKGTADESPILICRSAGKGLAVLLNFDWLHALHQAKSEKPAVTPAGDFLLDLLSLAGRKPVFPPQPGLPWNAVCHLSHADAVIVGLEGWRGGKRSREFQTGGDYPIHLLRSGIAADSKGRLVLPAQSPETVLFAVLPPAKREVAVRGPGHGPAGAALDFEVSIQVAGQPLAGSLLRMDVVAPDGAVLEAHRTFVLSGGGPVKFAWPVALDAPAGNYLLRATELVSGTKGEQQVKIQGGAVK